MTAAGVQAPAEMSEVRSPETYLGYERAENFVSPGGAVADVPHAYTAAVPRLMSGRSPGSGRSVASRPG